MIETLPNQMPGVQTKVRIQTPYNNACPVSSEPREGSWIAVEYIPKNHILCLDTIAKHLPTYSDEARDVETIVQMLAVDCQKALQSPITVYGHYLLRDGIVIDVQVEISNEEST